MLVTIEHVKRTYHYLAIIISQQYLNTDSKLYEIIDHHLSLETYQVASERLGNFMVAMTNFVTMNQFVKL
jgi:hypothetical protein